MGLSYVEIILQHVLYIIFRHLNIYDLVQASKVCKSWYHAAKIEKLKRGPQTMVLQALEDYVVTRFSDISPIDQNELVDDFKCSLRIKPSARLFLTDGKYPPTADCDNVAYETQQWTRPTDCYDVAIEALGVNVDENPIGGERNLTAAVLLPALPSVNYVFVESSHQCIEEYFNGENSAVKNNAEKLFSSGSDHACFIIFIYQWKNEPSYEMYHNHFLDDFLKTLKSSYKPGTYSLWGAAINDIFTLANDVRPSYESTSFWSMCLSGSSIKSWSIFLSDNLSNDEIEEKMLNFKKKVVLTSSSLAFVILPSGEDNLYRSRTTVFKNIFPTTKLISIFNNKNHAVLSVNSANDETISKLKHTNSYAYMILTYNLKTS